MSYSINLYNNIDAVIHNFNNRTKELKDFTELMKLQYDFNIEFTNGLKKVSEFSQQVLPNYSISDSFYIYRQSITNHYNFMLEFLERCKDGVLQPLIKFKDSHKKLGNSLSNDIKKNEKMYMDTIDRLEKAKLRYFSCNKALDEHRMKYEQSKFNQNINQEQRNKLLQKSETSAFEAKESEQIYIRQLELTNKDREIFIETNQKILSEFQQLQERYNKSLKDSFIKINQFLITFSNCLNNDLLNQLKVFENIDVEGDVNRFINTYEKPYSVPPKFEFVEYVPDYPMKSQQSKTSFFDFFFGKEKKNVEVEIEDRYSLEITSLTNSIWEGKLLTNEQIDNFMKLMKEKRCRKYFIVTLSKFRIKGLFTIEDKSFFQLGEVLNRVLNEVYINKDYEAFKSFLILSQTYYKKQENNEEKVFIQNLFETHEVCRDVEFWEEIIKFSIFEEYSNQHDLPVYSSDSPQEMKIRHQNLVFGQLVSYAYNILTFGLPKEKVKLVIAKFTDYYDLSEEYRMMLNMNIDEYILPESKKEKYEKLFNAETEESKQNLDSSNEYVVI